MINWLKLNSILVMVLAVVNVYSQCAIPSLIPNSDFEINSNCPTASGQITNAIGWQETSDFSADYYNCGFTNISTTYGVPPTSVSGSGYIGLANNSTGAKQYASTCLSSSLIAGLDYTYQFDIASATSAQNPSENSNTNFTMVLYGSLSCPAPTFTGSNCPSVGDGWIPIATVNVTSNNASWTTKNIEFVADAAYTSVALGPDCNVSPANAGICNFGICNNYYYIDNLILNLTSLYPTVEANADITNDCTNPTNPLQAVISGGTPNFSYSWEPSLGLSNASVSNPIADPLTTTDYIVTITDANGCVDKDTVKVTVDKVDPIANAGVDKTINCINPTVVLNASGGNSYLWSPATGLSSTSVINPTSTAQNTTTYTVTVIGNNGCSATDDVVVTVDKDLPVVTTGPDIATNCNFPDAQLTATGGGTYKWTPATALSNTNIPNPTARPPVTTVYTVTVTAPNGCKQTGSTSVIINDPTPIAEAGANKNSCGQYDLDLTPNISTQLPIDTYLWSLDPNYPYPSNPIIADNTDPNTNISNLVEGNYKFYWTVSNNVCPPVTDSVYILVHDIPIAKAGLDDSLCSIYTTDLNALPPVGRALGKWSLQSNFPNPNPAAVIFSNVNSPTSNVSGLQEGVYHFIWTVTNGSCAAKKDTVAISVFNNPISNAGIDDSLCNLFAVNLGASPPAGTSTGFWTENLNNVNPNVTFANNISPITNVSGLIEGTYEFIWTVSNGSCPDSIDTVKVNVYDSPIANAGSNTSICGYDTLYFDTLFFLDANSPAGTSLGKWTVYGVFNSSIPLFLNDTSPTTGVTNLLEGDYKFIWTVSNGNCLSTSDTVLISAFDKPIAEAGDSIFQCSDYVVDFSATEAIGSSIGKWSIASNWNNPSLIIIDDLDSSKTSSSNYIEGTYKFVWMVSNGNCDTITDTLVVTIYDQPIANAGSDIEMCASSFTSLNAVDPIGTSSGVWSQDFNYNSSTGINFDDDTLNTTNSINYVEGIYQLYWTVSNGVCDEAKDSMLVTTYNTPIANAGFDQYNCDLDTVALNASGNIGTATGEWFLDPNFNYPSIPIFRDSSNKNTIADNLIVGDYLMIWVVENGVCPSDTDTVVIFNLERPVAIADYSQQQCDNKCFEVRSLSTAPTGDGLLSHWEVDGVDYFDSNPEVCITTADDYEVKLTVTASNGCIDSLINYPLITVNPSPMAGFILNYETDSLIELQRVDVENLSSNDAQYFWYVMGNEDTIINNPDFIYFYNSFGMYEVTQWVENQYGCRDSIKTIQEVIKRRTAFVPNTFTPNNDGLNDVFIPITRAISSEKYEFTVFNRWGTMIFRSTSPSIGWDGTYKGRVVKDDAYIWKLQYTYDTSSEVVEQQGHVMVYKYSR